MMGLLEKVICHYHNVWVTTVFKRGLIPQHRHSNLNEGCDDPVVTRTVANMEHKQSYHKLE